MCKRFWRSPSLFAYMTGSCPTFKSIVSPFTKEKACIVRISRITVQTFNTYNFCHTGTLHHMALTSTLSSYLSRLRTIGTDAHTQTQYISLKIHFESAAAPRSQRNLHSFNSPSSCLAVHWTLKWHTHAPTIRILFCFDIAIKPVAVYDATLQSTTYTTNINKESSLNHYSAVHVFGSMYCLSFAVSFLSALRAAMSGPWYTHRNTNIPIRKPLNPKQLLIHRQNTHALCIHPLGPHCSVFGNTFTYRSNIHVHTDYWHLL